MRLALPSNLCALCVLCGDKKDIKPQITQTCAPIAHPHAPHVASFRRRLTANLHPQHLSTSRVIFGKINIL
ncbi:MAG: hypothetical protein WA144_11380 [Candidatus Methanoperedens sp.]